MQDRRRSLWLMLAVTAVLVVALLSGGAGSGLPAAAAQDGVTLTLLHNNDGESALLPTTNTVEPGTGYGNTEPVDLVVGGVASFKTMTTDQIADAQAAGNAVLDVYAGDAFLASSVLLCSLPPVNGPIYDAIAQRQIPYTAHIFGNHEFDFQPAFLEQFIRTFDAGAGLNQPFLSANLDFSMQEGFADLIDEDGLIVNAPEDNRPIAKSMIATDGATGEMFGIVGATTPLLPTISSPGDVQVTPDLEATAAAVQAEIDRLIDQGVNKIIFVSHLQDLDNDIMLIGMLSDVDIAVGGGGDEILLNSTIPATEQLLPGEDQSQIYGDYPYEVIDADGQTVYLVTTRGNYKYVGRLDAEFDAAGEVTNIITDSSYPRRVIPDDANDAATLTTLGVTDAVTPDAALVSSVVEPVQQCLEDFANTGVAFSEVVLDVSRNRVRAAESNAGNLIADAFIYAYEQLAADSGVTAENPVVAVTNGGGIRQNAGDFLSDVISGQNTLDVLPFPNDVSVIENVTPQTLKEVFEHSVGEDLPDGRFLQVGGISVTYDLDRAMGDRVVSLTLADGTPIVQEGELVDGAPNVNLVTNSFTAGGGDDYSMLADLDKIDLLDTGKISYERALVKYLTEDNDSFPIDSDTGLPTIQESDPRYQPGGEGRIKFQEQYYWPFIAG